MGLQDMSDYQYPTLIQSRGEFCDQRLIDLENGLTKLPSLASRHGLCIYVTGSYARREASRHSDLDLFFMHEGSQEHNEIPKLAQITIFSEINEHCVVQGFPAFSDDARFLRVHYIEDVLDLLGGPADDYENNFTARMLLLLESRPLVGRDTYRTIIRKTIAAYYRDYHGHKDHFRPLFLVNDILRYWKTICLNYEHKRNRPPRDDRRRNQQHIRNLKFKFSRLLLCYSFTLPLSIDSSVIRPGDAYELTQITPLDRLTSLTTRENSPVGLIDEIVTLYDWFLTVTGRPESEVLEWIALEVNRNQAFDKGRDFGQLMFEVLRDLVPDKSLRYLVM